MKKVVLILAFLSVGVTFAQNTKAELKVVSQFETAYNASNYEAIHKLYNEAKQSKFSLEDTKKFFERIKSSRGDISSITLVRKQKEYTVYKVVYTKSIGELVVKLDNNDKAEMLALRNTETVKQ